jgi:C1A family cysteine protease
MSEKKYNIIIQKLPYHLLNFKKEPRIKSRYLLPHAINLRSKMPPVYDQLDTNSCTSQALVAAYQFMNPSFMGSRLFLYYNERSDINQDDGALIQDGIRALEIYGLCPEIDWPFDITKINIKPTPKCYIDALKHKVLKAHNIHDDIYSIKTALVQEKPIILGIQIYESFESENAIKTGIVPMPKPDEICRGGHCIVLVSYNDNTRLWGVRNSWNSNVGDGGYFYLPYEYLLTPELCSDFWVLDKVN